MFGLLRRASCQNNPHPTRMVRPFLEALESRYCPSTSTSTLSLNVSYAANRQVTLSGQLTNTGTLGGQTIRITGAVATTATTDANGNYTVTLTASQLGEVDAQTADNQSNVAINNLTASTPTITQFGAVKGDLNSMQTVGSTSRWRSIRAITEWSARKRPTGGAFTLEWSTP